MKSLLSCLILAAFAAQAGAQVIRTETQVVLVDVAVTDKKGSYVRDLEAGDFRVWEDGKEQKILSLSRVAGGGPNASPQRSASFTLLLFDLASMNGSELAWAQEVAGTFVDANAAEDHSIAVAGFTGGMRVAQTFTIDVRRLKRALNQQTLGAVSTREEGTSSAQAAIVARDLLRDLDKLSKNLDSVPGRKSVLFFTTGFPVTTDNSGRLEQAIESANRANVAIYPINVRSAVQAPAQLPVNQRSPQAGRRPGAPSIQTRGQEGDIPAGASEAQTATASLGVMVSLAEGTGGFVARQAGDTATLNQIAKEQKEYYLLGYTPPEGSRGSCHKLRVSVERKDTEFRARKEYCNLTRGDLLSGNPVEQVLEQRAATADAGNIQATMQAPFFYMAANRARVALAMEIDASKSSFRRENGRYLTLFNILGVATRTDGSIGARFSDTVKLDFDDQKQVDEFKRAPFRYTTQFDAASGNYNFVVVVSSGDANHGRVEMPLAIEPYQPDQFALSALALSTSFRAAAAGLGDLDELLGDDSKKFVVNEVEADLAGTAVVSRNSRTVFYAEIYEPLLAAPNPAAPVLVGIQIRVLEAATGVPAFDSGLMRLDVSQNAGRAALPILQIVPVEMLPPGRYTLDVEAVDGADRTARRTLPFELK